MADDRTHVPFPSTTDELDRSKGFVDRPPPPKNSRNGAYVTVAVLWGLGVALLFLPYANFYLSPLLFLAGAIYAWKVWHEGSVARSGRA